MNERKKIKFRMSEWDILGIVFTLLGTIFLIIGIPISVLEETVGTIFVLIGLPEFAIGVFCLYHAKKKRDAKNKVFSTGTRIEAKIHRIAYHSSVRVNGRAAHVIECSYRDPVNNIIHVFKSENVFKDITLLKEGDSIFVYVNPVDYNQYYVDIDSAFERAGIIHR